MRQEETTILVAFRESLSLVMRRYIITMGWLASAIGGVLGREQGNVELS